MHPVLLLVNTSGNEVLSSYREGNPSLVCASYNSLFPFCRWLPIKGINLMGSYIFQNVQYIPLNLRTASFV